MNGLREAFKRGVKRIGGGLAGADFEGPVQAREVGLGVSQQLQRVAGLVVAVGG